LQAYRHWPGDISYQITLTATTASNQWTGKTDAANDLDVSHTKCASLVTDAQRNGVIKKL